VLFTTNLYFDCGAEADAPFVAVVCVSPTSSERMVLMMVVFQNSVLEWS